jgi:hypothetical protein
LCFELKGLDLEVSGCLRCGSCQKLIQEKQQIIALTAHGVIVKVRMVEESLAVLRGSGGSWSLLNQPFLRGPFEGDEGIIASMLGRKFLVVSPN